MFTRCPDCHAIYPLRASWLAQDRGKVECGRCGKIYNALKHLFDDWPEPDEVPISAAEQNQPFHLSHRFTNEPDAATQNNGYQGAVVVADEENPTDDQPQPDPNQLNLLPAKSYHWVWNALLIALIPLTLANFSWHYRQPLLEIPTIRTTAEGLGLVEMQQSKARQNPELFQLLSRDLHAHPSRADALILSLTMVNRADYRQDFPQIELSLLDTNNRVLARKILQPDEYLTDGSDSSHGLAPDALLPVVIEFLDPGIASRGFEIRFL